MSRNLMIRLDGKGNGGWEKHGPFISPDQLGALRNFKKHVVNGEVY